LIHPPLTSFLLATLLLGGCAATAPSAGPEPAPGPGPAQPAPDSDAGTAGQDQLPEPAASPEPRQPARTEAPTLALLRQSERSADGGDLQSAIAYVERAIRLDSRDADLWLRLAELQLAADRPATAEQLAQKGIALAGDARTTRRRGWLLVADAREAQGDADGAREIRQRWRTYRG
jgi:tetratricopeptide (TPR) repeat protein